MKHIRRMIGGSILGALLAFTMTAAPAAAATALYVDDLAANNGSVSCPGTPYTTLQSAVAALGATSHNVTITICPGDYAAATTASVFFSFTNLKLQGKGGPYIDASGYAGSLIVVVNSTNVTVSGLNINGGSDLGSGSVSGIQYVDSSGTIKNNVIADWHQDYYSPLTTSVYGIVVGTTSLAHKVTVDRNTVFDVQDIGILSIGPAKARITKNQVVLHSDVDVTPYFAPGPKVQAGVMLYNSGAGGVVSGNVVESNTGMAPYPCVSPCLIPDSNTRGIFLLQTSGVKVTGNRASHLLYGIAVESWCYGSGPYAANKNTISGNKLYNNRAGVYIHALNYYGGGCVAHADKNVVKGNKINRNYSGAFFGVWRSATLPATAAGTGLTGNTLRGYRTTPMDTFFPVSGTGVSGPAPSGNTVSSMPLTGALP